ncbi:UvrD-helicase domain-containing protein [Thioalkalivibrio nitratireducens]|nr:UvrD-helicase domain-containing protein [Thioalkalivibrio nitratireducens]
MNIRFISAGAGSGKTHRLTELLGELLTQGRVRPGGVIATTFTRKAAGDLVQRVRQRLHAEGRHRDAMCIAQGRIGTVNSVCGELLSRYAFEAGLSPRVQVMDETDAPVLFAQALDQVAGPAQIRALNRLGWRLGQDDWRETVRDLAELARANGLAPGELAVHAERSIAGLLGHFPAPEAGTPDQDLLQAVTESLRSLSAEGDATQKTRHEVVYL